MQGSSDSNITKLLISKLNIVLIVKLGFLTKILQTFEEEFVERNELNSGNEQRYGQIKDGIREYAIKEIVYLLQQALLNFEQFDEEQIEDILEVFAQLIDWNAIEIFNQSILIFKEMLINGKFKVGAIKCLQAVVTKGMDYHLKVELIVNLEFMQLLESFQIKFRETLTDEYSEE